MVQTQGASTDGAGGSAAPPVPAQAPVDDFTLEWTDFEDFFSRRAASEEEYLVELGAEPGERRTWTTGEWREEVAKVAGFLRSRGVQPGAVVATLAGNSALGLSVAFACWTIGAAVMPLNPGETDARLEYVLKDAGTHLLVCSEQFDGIAAQLARACGLSAYNATREGFAHEEAGEDRRTESAGVDAGALLVYTSGTTGAPKPVGLTVRNLLTHTHGLTAALGWTERERVITVLPIHHVNGLLISCLLPWHIGASTVLCDRFRSDRFWDDVEREGATVTSVVPSLLEFLMGGGGERKGLLTEVLCGAGPLRPDAAVGFEQEFDVPVRHLYGLSEVTAVASIMPRLPREVRERLYQDHGFPSFGRPIPHVEVEVLNSGSERCEPGERGQLAVRGATVFGGYRMQGVEEPFAGGWFLSGDQGFWVEEGGERYFFIAGRTKELIIRGGVNLAPVEIDAVLMSHEAVSFGLAIPFENRFYGEEVAAYVVPAADVTEQELIAHCRERLGFEKSPKVVVFGKDVPFTSTGKARRLELKDTLAPELARYRDTQFRR